MIPDGPRTHDGRLISDGAASILLVGADRALRSIVHEALQHGASVVEVEHAASAVERCRAGFPFDCIVVASPLPDLEVAALLAALSGSEGAARYPVIVAADGCERSQALAWLRAGAQDCVNTRWLTPESFAHAVDMAVERWRLTGALHGRLREREQRLRLALRAGRTGVWTWECATEQLSWSEETYAICGVAPVGRPVGFDDFIGAVHPDDRPSVLRVIDDALAHGSEYRNEFRISRKDGSVRRVLGLGLVVRDGRGAALSMLGTITDVTEQQLAAENLRERERQLQSVADNTPDILARFDRNLRHVFVNRAIEPATGLAPEAFLGKTNRELGMSDALCTQWERALRCVFETGQAMSYAFQFDGPEGLLYYAARLVPERGPAGDVAFALCVSHDVTEIKQAEQALLEADRRKDVFIATLAHELRNPLAPIRLGVELLRRPDERQLHAQTVSMIERQVEQLVRLIDDLMDVARIATGKVALRREPVRMQDVVARALEMSQVALERARHDLRIETSPDTLWVDGDPARLMQVVANLLNNAAKYTPESGRIDVQLAREGGHAVITVVDSGLGIPPDMLSRIFELFTQVDGTVERAQGGLGIGLALVKQLVDLHGGSVQAHSAGIGSGSRFSVRLPLLERAFSVQSDVREASAHRSL